LGVNFDQIDACIFGGILQVVLHDPFFSMSLSCISTPSLTKRILGVRVRPIRFAEVLITRFDEIVSVRRLQRGILLLLVRLPNYGEKALRLLRIVFGVAMLHLLIKQVL
jgi:hypothetical protein